MSAAMEWSTNQRRSSPRCSLIRRSSYCITLNPGIVFRLRPFPRFAGNCPNPAKQPLAPGPHAQSLMPTCLIPNT